MTMFRSTKKKSTISCDRSYKVKNNTSKEVLGYKFYNIQKKWC